MTHRSVGQVLPRAASLHPSQDGPQQPVLPLGSQHLGRRHRPRRPRSLQRLLTCPPAGAPRCKGFPFFSTGNKVWFQKETRKGIQDWAGRFCCSWSSFSRGRTDQLPGFMGRRGLRWAGPRQPALPHLQSAPLSPAHRHLPCKLVPLTGVPGEPLRGNDPAPETLLLTGNMATLESCQ